MCFDTGKWISVASVVLLWASVSAVANEVVADEMDKPVPESLYELQLPVVGGSVAQVLPRDQAGLSVFCFLGAECPLAKLYGPRLQRMSETYADRQVRFLGINSNLQDSLDKLAEYGKTHEITFPLFKDYDHRLADLLEAKRTPEIVVVDASGRVRYRGRIDDQYQPGANRDRPRNHHLEDALRQLLAGETVAVRQTDPVGCLIGRAFAGEVTSRWTYCKDISRLLQQHCVECHRPHEIGPFSLLDYDEVIGWGEMMLEVVHDGRMPPWHANPAHGSYANERGMTSKEKQMLEEWVRGGMPYGDAAELPPPEKYLAGWQLSREPDQIVKMSKTPYRVAADGVIEYQYFVVDPGFCEDRWIIGAQVMPGNRAVVHHCIVFVRPPDGKELKGLGWISAYVPGQRSVMLPPGHARRVAAGSQLVFQMHYTPNGSEQEDVTTLGLLFGEERDITHEVFTLPAINRNFEIPPHAADYAVHGGTSRIPRNGQILALSPHMHYRGKAFQASVVKEGDETILLDVPRYDFNWQHVYELVAPVSLARVSQLKFTARFDNSRENPFNPDPSAFVTWGDQSWEEMAIAFFEVAIPRGESLDYAPAEPQEDSDVLNARQAEEAEAREKALNQFVEDFFSRFDADRDGVVTRGEMPLAQQRFGFRKLDRNDDGKLDREEIAEHYRNRQRATSQ